MVYDKGTHSSNAAMVIRDWELHGSTDDSAWDLLDSQADQGSWGHYEERTFSL